MKISKRPMKLLNCTLTIAILAAITAFSSLVSPLLAQESDRLTELVQQCEELEKEEKLAACDRAIELDGNNYTALFHRGRALLNLGQYSEAKSAFDKAGSQLASSQQRYLQELVINNLAIPERRRAYVVFANFARQRVALGLHQCLSQIPSQFQTIQSLLQDEQRIQRIDEAIASEMLSGDRLEQLQTIREQIRILQRNPENLDRQRVQALATCQERFDELIQNIDEDLSNNLESLEKNN